MAVMRMVQVTINQIIDVVAMGYRFVAAAWSVYVVRVVVAAGMLRGAAVRVLLRHRNYVLFDGPVFSLVVQMPIVEIVRVAVMLDRRMAASGSVLMIVALMSMCHRSYLLLEFGGIVTCFR